MNVPESFMPLVSMFILKGYGASLQRSLPVDLEGNPLPWIAYPAIDFLRGLDLRDKRLFEFGAGSSTLFWAKLCKEVMSVESDPVWHQRISSTAPANCRVLLRQDENTYLDSIDEDTRAFDVIVIDGAFNRRKMAERSIGKLAPGGFVILDNSDCHVRSAKVLRDAGMIQVDMIGVGPMYHHEVATSFFFRRDYSVQPIGQWQPLKSGSTGSRVGSFWVWK